MKQKTAFLLVLTVLLSCLSFAAPGVVAETAAEARLGVGVVTDITGSTSATEDADGQAKVDVATVVVLLDSDDTILDVAMDMIQPYTSFNASGAIVETKDFQTKRELKDAYGMHKASPIGLEWYEQAANFEEYMIGKTVDEVLSMDLNEEYRPTDEDLAATVTIHVDSYLEALAKAAENAVSIGSSATDKVGLAILGNTHDAVDASADADGYAQAYMYIAAVTVDADGVITAGVMNALQAKVAFDAEGQITTDLAAPVLTKNELGDAYGMRKASSIDKEWYEQAASFIEYVVGKTTADLADILAEDNTAADADLLASVTVHINDMQASVVKAVNDALSVVEDEVVADGVKTGLAIITDVSGSTSADGDTNGTAKVDITVVAVLVDVDGTIVDVKIDVVQPYTRFTSEGKLVETRNVMTKRELGYDYGMVVASAIGAEWFEQAAAFESYIRGKTLDEVLTLEVDDQFRPAETTDLASSVTVHVNSYMAALEKAVNSAQVLGASATDSLGLGIVSNTHRSTDADGDKDGNTQAYSHFAAVTFDADGVVTSALINAAQANVAFDAAGQITTDVSVEQVSKQELGDAYGMRKASSIDKEWYEQANGYAEFIVGKTLDEIVDLADETGHAADEDLLASVTVTVSDMLEATVKAYQDAFVLAE